MSGEKHVCRACTEKTTGRALLLHRQRHHALAIAVMISLAASTANADEDEVSVNVQAFYGKALLGDETAGDLTDEVGFLGIGGRMTYATSDWFAYEAHLSYNAADTATYEIDPETVVFRSPSWIRLDTGITARLGTLWTPTIMATVGLQMRPSGEGRQFLDGVWTGAVENDWSIDLVGTLGVGLDYRINGNLVVGANIMAQRALSIGSHWETTAGMIHVGYYWFWFPGSEF